MERRIGTQEPNETKMSIPFTVPTFVHECLVKNVVASSKKVSRMIYMFNLERTKWKQNHECNHEISGTLYVSTMYESGYGLVISRVP